MNPSMDLPSITTPLSMPSRPRPFTGILTTFSQPIQPSPQARLSRFGSHDMFTGTAWALFVNDRSWFNVHVINGRVRCPSKQRFPLKLYCVHVEHPREHEATQTLQLDSTFTWNAHVASRGLS